MNFFSSPASCLQGWDGASAVDRTHPDNGSALQPNTVQRGGRWSELVVDEHLLYGY